MTDSTPARQCAGCGRDLPATTRGKYCPNGRSACRTRVYYAKQDLRQARAWDLLKRQTAAVIRGDSAALTAIAAEAQAFFASAA